MKVLTIKQPWANFILEAGKNVENRVWKTDFRGQILIHTSKKIDENYPKQLIQQQEKDLVYLYNDTTVMVKPNELGVIIGAVTISDCISNSKSKWAASNCYHWILKNPILFDEKDMIKIPGQLKLWDFSNEQALTKLHKYKLER